MYCSCARILSWFMYVCVFVECGFAHWYFCIFIKTILFLMVREFMAGACTFCLRVHTYVLMCAMLSVFKT